MKIINNYRKRKIIVIQSFQFISVGFVMKTIGRKILCKTIQQN